MGVSGNDPQWQQATVQLLGLTWHITDTHGRVQHVHRKGVIGEQPVLEPGESF